MISANSPSKTFHITSRVNAVRVVVLGPPGVGVSSLVRRFCVDTFEEAPSSSSSTWGARFHTKLLLASDQVLRFQLWDVPGGDELLAPVYLANAHVCLVCFDLSRPKTLGAATAMLRGVSGQVSFVHLFPLSSLTLVRSARTECGRWCWWAARQIWLATNFRPC